MTSRFFVLSIHSHANIPWSRSALLTSMQMPRCGNRSPQRACQPDDMVRTSSHLLPASILSSALLIHPNTRHCSYTYIVSSKTACIRRCAVPKVQEYRICTYMHLGSPHIKVPRPYATCHAVTLAALRDQEETKAWEMLAARRL